MFWDILENVVNFCEIFEYTVNVFGKYLNMLGNFGKILEFHML